MTVHPVSTCRDCGEPIRWEKTRTGKNVPLDPEPTSAGDVVVESLATGTPQVAVQLAPRAADVYTGEKYTYHWKTCRNRRKP